jgi:hypothetical protein
VLLTVTCATEGCENAGVAIDVDATAPYLVVCGPCETVLAKDNTNSVKTDVTG